jgi:hypothetical protein
VSSISLYYDNQSFNPELLIEPDFSDCPFPDFSFGYDVGAPDLFSGVDIPEFHQLVDFSTDSLSGAALVKTCEKFGHNENQRIEQSKTNIGTPVSSLAFSLALQKHKEAGGSVSDFLEYDEKKRKQEQKRIKPLIKAASNFHVLAEMKKIQKTKKAKELLSIEAINQLKLFDMNSSGECVEVRLIDKETGELQTIKITGKGNKRKFLLQTTQTKIQDRFSMQSVMARLLPEYRVSKCLNVVQSKIKGCDVFKSNTYGKVSISNVQTCGSVWHCPVCAAKITERRRVEMETAINAHKAAGGSISFVTRTVPHTNKLSLLNFRDSFRLSDKFMKESRTYKNMLPRFQCSGNIKAFELTVGEFNGWHLHVHEVFFHDAAAFEGLALEANPAYVAFLNDFEQTYFDIWHDAAVKAGFYSPSRKHGLQIQNGDFAAEYIAKWGVEPQSKWNSSTELTKAHVKSSFKGFTPWELIRFYRDTENEQLIPIIQEYAHTMHSQQQLIWSKGLKKKYEIKDMTDEQISDEIEDDAEKIGVLSPVQWQFIVKNDLRAEFFTMAAEGWDVLTEFLHSFDDYPKIFFLESDSVDSPVLRG